MYNPIYRYIRPDGGITDSTTQPDCEFILRYRLIADEGKMYTLDGVNRVSVLDVDSLDGWYEVDKPTEETTVAEK